MLLKQNSELLEIVKNGSNQTDKIFRVYKSGKRVPAGNMNSEFYTLYFCSEELTIS